MKHVNTAIYGASGADSELTLCETRVLVGKPAEQVSTHRKRFERRGCILRSATLLSSFCFQSSPCDCHPYWKKPLLAGLGGRFRSRRKRCCHGWSITLAEQVKAHRKRSERWGCILRSATLLSSFCIQSSSCECRPYWSKPLLAGLDGRSRCRRERCRCGFWLFCCCSGFRLRSTALAGCEYQNGGNNNDPAAHLISLSC
jgi:hypothetical protein